mmetsp:Transcript_15178/g.32134  ORF Transcript_15178/g.32134 Transcript_15178/m.32134 type:complete len:102 (+) Transcript_15178:42-347(+)
MTDPLPMAAQRPRITPLQATIPIDDQDLFVTSMARYECRYSDGFDAAASRQVIFGMAVEKSTIYNTQQQSPAAEVQPALPMTDITIIRQYKEEGVRWPMRD